MRQWAIQFLSCQPETSTETTNMNIPIFLSGHLTPAQHRFSELFTSNQMAHCSGFISQNELPHPRSEVSAKALTVSQGRKLKKLLIIWNDRESDYCVIEEAPERRTSAGRIGTCGKKRERYEKEKKIWIKQKISFKQKRNNKFTDCFCSSFITYKF